VAPAFGRRSAALLLIVLSGTFGACFSSSESGALAEPPASSYSSTTFELATDLFSETVTGASVSSEFFPAARTPPLLGRVLLDSETSSSSAPVAVISYPLWVRRFGSAPTTVGRRIRVNGRETVVVGIAPRGFDVPKGALIWVPR
jgi:hypothetical protein